MKPADFTNVYGIRSDIQTAFQLLDACYAREQKSYFIKGHVIAEVLTKLYYNY